MKITFKRGDELPAGLTEVIDSDGDKWVRRDSTDFFTYTSPGGFLSSERWTYLTNTYSGYLTGEVPDSVTDAPATPRVWNITQPDGVTRVRDFNGDVYVLAGNGVHWFLDGTSEYPRSWSFLLSNRAPLTEVTESDYDAAVRRLQENRDDSDGIGVPWYAQRTDDLKTVLAEVLK